MHISTFRFVFLLCAVLLTACGSVVHRATRQFADNLTTAILNQDDPATVHDGVPSLRERFRLVQAPVPARSGDQLVSIQRAKQTLKSTIEISGR